MSNYIKLIIALVLNFLFLRGIYDTVINLHPNKCEMTYMYEYPQYMEVKLESEYNYKLFVYGEGQYSEELARGIFKGIPVLFIPGNQGSYKQVRSLGSVAYTKSKKGHPFHFNFFTVDFNEEIGALFGPVLEQETHFVGLAIRTIIGLYKNSQKKPQSVVLVGHSVGGLVARAVMGSADISSELVSIIITLATPHAQPVIIPDSSLMSFYGTINDYWSKERDFDLNNVVFVTIGGGKNDIQVPSALTTSKFADIDETLSSVPLCWLTTDHRAIVWCKQLVLAVTRALFNSVDTSTLQISSRRSDIINAFRYHLSEKTGEAHSFSSIKQRIVRKIKRKDDWLEMKELHHSEKFKKTLTHKLIAIPISYERDRQHVSVVFPEDHSWIMACKADVDSDLLTLSSGEDLHQYSRIIPGKRKEVNIDAWSLQGTNFTHIVAFVESSNTKSSIDVDISDGGSRRMSVTAPPFLSSFTPVLLMESTPPKSLTLNVTIKSFTEIWQSFTLHLAPINTCSPENNYPLVSLRSSWANRWEFILNKDSSHEFNLEVDIPSPTTSEEGFVEVHILKSPSCSYSVSLQKNLRGIFERITLLYAPQFPAFIVSHLLLALSSLYKTFSSVKESFYSRLFRLSPVAVIPFVKLGALGISKITDVESDTSYSETNRLNIEVIPLVLFLSALPLTIVIVSLSRMLLVGISKGAYFCVSRTFKSEENAIEIPAPRFFSVSSLGVVLLLSLGVSTCGTLPLFIATGVYFIKVVKMYINRLRKFSHKFSKTDNSSDVAEIDSEDSSVDFHFMMMLLTLLVSVLNLPSLITWARNFRSQEQLVSDPSLFVCAAILFSLAVLWQIKTAKPNKKFYKHVGYIIHLGSILVILFGAVFIYRMNEIVSCTFLIIALHQLMAPE